MIGKTDRGQGARRGWDDDTSTVSSTAVTSPEAEERGVKNDATLSGHGFETDRPVRTFQADTPLSGARSSEIDFFLKTKIDCKSQQNDERHFGLR